LLGHELAARRVSGFDPVHCYLLLDLCRQDGL
jgi:hypothetical protein